MARTRSACPLVLRTLRLGFGIVRNMEEWRPVNNFPKYEVSSHGRVRNVRTGEVLTQKVRGNRSRVSLFGENNKRKKVTVTVSRIVAEAFLPDWKPDGKDSDVKRRDRDGSNNAVDNLFMGSRWKRQKPLENGKIECYKDGVYQKTFDSLKAAEAATGGKSGNISNVLAGKRQTAGGYEWRYAQSEIIPGEEWRPFKSVEVSSMGRMRRLSRGGYARGSSEMPTDCEGYPIFGIDGRPGRPTGVGYIDREHPTRPRHRPDQGQEARGEHRPGYQMGDRTVLVHRRGVQGHGTARIQDPGPCQWDSRETRVAASFGLD